MDRLTAAILMISTYAVWLGGAMLLGSVFLISTEVILRKVFIVSTGGADEISSYAFCISTSWAMSYALLDRAHLRIDALYLHLPTRVSALLDYLALAAITVFACAISYFVAQTLAETFTLSARANTQLGTPLWIPQTLWLAGFVLFLASAATLMARATKALVTGNITQIEGIFSAKTVDEELDEEIGEQAAGQS